ncbi:sugar lactone lactonase YvrE [Pedobacter sp. CG_S7]|uniref:SMP-30/gluconolactonase/LRE family protein n=1 Tax=Pedobacter sp. CG_S7 TaxID=3143930 RepID=UPI003395DC70
MEHSILEIVVEHKCVLGEGPIWDGVSSQLIWLDIDEMEIHQYLEKNQVFKTTKFSKKVTAVVLNKNGGLVAAVEDGFAAIDLENGAVKMIATINEKGNRFNDGKCDPNGTFWAGTTSYKEIIGSANVYELNTNGNTKRILEHVTISNGMAWSLDQQTFYYIDTPTCEVVSYKYHKNTGAIEGKKTVCKINYGYPDGMTIDADGMLWIALWDGGKLIRVDPESGVILKEVLLPVSNVTCCVFGGDDLENLYITTARSGLSEQELLDQPLAGSLFVLKNSGFKGVKAFEYNAGK